MHAEIIRDEPGNCPICGMTLELRDMTRRLWLTAVLAAPLLTIAMGMHIPVVE
jgi:Cu+-exporting ATPase